MDLKAFTNEPNNSGCFDPNYLIDDLGGCITILQARVHDAEQARDDAKKAGQNWYDEFKKAEGVLREIIKLIDGNDVYGTLRFFENEEAATALEDWVGWVERHVPRVNA
jgi:hypothetical protein